MHSDTQDLMSFIFAIYIVAAGPCSFIPVWMTSSCWKVGSQVKIWYAIGRCWFVESHILLYSFVVLQMRTLNVFVRNGHAKDFHVYDIIIGFSSFTLVWMSLIFRYCYRGHKKSKHIFSFFSTKYTIVRMKFSSWFWLWQNPHFQFWLYLP